MCVGGGGDGGIFLLFWIQLHCPKVKKKKERRRPPYIAALAVKESKAGSFLSGSKRQELVGAACLELARGTALKGLHDRAAEKVRRVRHELARPFVRGAWHAAARRAAPFVQQRVAVLEGLIMWRRGCATKTERRALFSPPFCYVDRHCTKANILKANSKPCNSNPPSFVVRGGGGLVQKQYSYSYCFCFSYNFQDMCGQQRSAFCIHRQRPKEILHYCESS